MPKSATEPVFKRANSRFWQIRYTDANHREVRISSGTEDYAQAEALYAALKGGAKLTLIDTAEKFFDHKEMSEKTATCYRTSFRAWVDCIGNPRLDMFNQETLRDFVGQRTGTVQENTIRNDLAFMSSLFKFAMSQHGGPTANPVKAYDKSGLATSTVRVKCLRPDQVRKLMSKIKMDHRKLIVLFGLEAGLRKNEILTH